MYLPETAHASHLESVHTCLRVGEGVQRLGPWSVLGSRHGTSLRGQEENLVTEMEKGGGSEVSNGCVAKARAGKMQPRRPQGPPRVANVQASSPRGDRGGFPSSGRRVVKMFWRNFMRGRLSGKRCFQMASSDRARAVRLNFELKPDTYAGTSYWKKKRYVGAYGKAAGSRRGQRNISVE